MDSFDLMPLSCIVNGRFLAVHGGISPDLKTVFIIYSILLVSSSDAYKSYDSYNIDSYSLIK